MRRLLFYRTLILTLSCALLFPQSLYAWHTSGGAYSRTQSVDYAVSPAIYRRWEHEIRGTAFSQPATDGRNLFIGTDGGELRAIDTRTGEYRWHIETSPRSRIRMTPSVEDGVVYFGTADGRLLAALAETGQVLWQFAAAGWVTGSPVVSEGRVYLSNYDGWVYALDTGGNQVWSHSSKGDFINAPLAHAKGAIIYGTMTGKVVALNQHCGSVIWSQQTTGWISGIAYDQSSGALIVTSVGPRVGGILRLNLENGERVWQYASPANNYWSAPAIHGGTVWAGNLGYLVCLSIDTGSVSWFWEAPHARVVVSGRQRSFAPVVRTPVIGPGGGYVVLTFEVQAPARLAYISSQGAVLGLKDLAVAPAATPVYSDNTLYLVTTAGFIEAHSPVDIVLDDVRVCFGETPPLLVNGSTLVPLRTLSEAYGAAVGWEAETRTVTVSRGQVSISIVIDSSHATVNGNVQSLSAPARIIGGRTYVPLRFLAENLLSASIHWDQQALRATISTK